MPVTTVILRLFTKQRSEEHKSPPSSSGRSSSRRLWRSAGHCRLFRRMPEEQHQKQRYQYAMRLLACWTKFFLPSECSHRTKAYIRVHILFINSSHTLAKAEEAVWIVCACQTVCQVWSTVQAHTLDWTPIVDQHTIYLSQLSSHFNGWTVRRTRLSSVPYSQCVQFRSAECPVKSDKSDYD